MLLSTWVMQLVHSSRGRCWIPVLCSAETRVSFTFPRQNRTDIYIHLFAEPQFDKDHDDDDQNVQFVHESAYMESVCIQLVLKDVFQTAMPTNPLDQSTTTTKTNNNLPSMQRTAIHCENILSNTSDVSVVALHLPFAVLPGRYDMFYQRTFIPSDAVNVSAATGFVPFASAPTDRGGDQDGGSTGFITTTEVLSYIILQREDPPMPFSLLFTLTPQYGSLLRDHFLLNVFNNYESIRQSAEYAPFTPDTFSFNVHGLHQYLLPPHVSTANSFGGPKIEAGSWFFQVLPLKVPETIGKGLAESEAVQQTLSLDVPDLYLSPITGEHIGKAKPVDSKHTFYTGHAAEGYFEVVLSDTDLDRQRLFVHDHASLVNAQSKHLSRRQVAQQIQQWQVQLNDLYNHRRKSTNYEIPARTHRPNRHQTASNKINVCIFGSSRMDGQKRIWLQQAESLDKSKFQFNWLMPQEVHPENVQFDTNYVFFHLNRLPHVRLGNNTSNGYVLTLERLHEVPDDSFITAAMVWDYNVTKLYQYIHQRYEKANGDISKISPSFCRDLYQGFIDMFQREACDIVVYGNGRGYSTDVFINDAARYLRIPTATELLNLYLESDILPDVVIAPSKHSWLHESIQDPIRVHTKRGGIQPVGVVIAPATDTQHFNPEPFRMLAPLRQPKHCEVIGSGTDFRQEISMDDFLNSFYKHRPCVVIGFVARISGGMFGAVV
jgi:hypothetical protein